MARLTLLLYYILPPFQNVGRFDFFRFIVFAMHLDITYVYVHSKIYESRKVKTTYILKWRDYYIVATHHSLVATHSIPAIDGSSVDATFTSLSRSRRLHGSIVHGCLLHLSTSFTLGQ